MNQNKKTGVIISSILAGLLILFYLSGSFLGCQGNNFGMMGGSGTMFFMPIIGVIFLGLMFFAVAGAIRSSGDSDSIDSEMDSAMEILKRRYARGEIDKEEYEAKKNDLM